MPPQFKVSLPRLGIDVRFVEGNNANDFEQHIDDRTKAMFAVLCCVIHFILSQFH